MLASFLKRAYCLRFLSICLLKDGAFPHKKKEVRHMERAGKKTRDIQFFSKKNGAMVCLHSPAARDYAKYLEEQPWVVSYEAGAPLSEDLYCHISPVGIRGLYFKTSWESDFLLHLLKNWMSLVFFPARSMCLTSFFFKIKISFDSPNQNQLGVRFPAALRGRAAWH